MENQDVTASPAQLRYANMLNYGSIIGFVILLISFAVYLLSVLDPFIPVDKLVATWHLSSAEFNTLHKVPAGWGWVSLLATGDFSNFLGIAILAGVTILCYMQLALDCFRDQEKLMGIIAVLEVLVLLFAASGIVGGAH